MMVRRLSSLLCALAAAALLLTATGCDGSHVCTQAGCAASRLTFDTEGWAPGDYEVELSYTRRGDHAFVCTFSIGDDGRAAPDDAGYAGYMSTCTQTKGEDRAVNLYPYSLPTLTLEVFDEPDEVRILVRNSDATLSDHLFTLDQVTMYPNGPDCGSCRAATMTISLPRRGAYL